MSLDVFDVDYFIEQTRGYVEIVKEIPAEIASKEPFKVDCSKRKGRFDYVETVLPVLLEHQYISLTPSMNQRRDSYRSSRDDGSRNEEWGTGNGTLDAFLHCRNENVLAFPFCGDHGPTVNNH